MSTATVCVLALLIGFEADVREWTGSSGWFRGEAAFVSVEMGAVQAGKPEPASAPPEPDLGSWLRKPRVREEKTGGRVELGRPREVFVMVVARALARPGGGLPQDAHALMYLPPTTERQTVHQLACLPAPAEVTRDPWGNEIARFVLDRPGPGGVATACWMARITLRPLTTRLIEGVPPPAAKEAEAARRLYLGDNPAYQLTSGPVREAVESLRASASDPKAYCEALFRYLKARLVYERAGGWSNAAKVLQQGKGSCSEAAYCWIALARANGIPARYTGALNCSLGDGAYDAARHRWAEVFLPKWGWVPADHFGIRDFAAPGVRTHLLQLCWCADGTPPMGWQYHAAGRQAAIAVFSCPAEKASAFAKTLTLAERVFGNEGAAAARGALAEIESSGAHDVIPLLEDFLYWRDEELARRAARKLYALVPRTARELRPRVRDFPEAWEAMNAGLLALASPGHREPETATWNDCAPGGDLTGWAGDTRGLQVVDGEIRSQSEQRLCLAPRRVGRWYELEMEFNVPDNAHADLVLADAGLGRRVHVPFWTGQSKARNRLVGANSVVGSYAAQPGQWHKARVLVCDDEMWLDLDGKRALYARDGAIGPGRVGFATGNEPGPVRIRSFRVRDLGRDQAQAEKKGHT